MESFFSKYINAVKQTETILYTGYVTSVKGFTIEANGPRSVIGEICTIKISDGNEVLAEVMGFEENTVKLMAYSDTKGISKGCEIVASGHVLSVPVGKSFLGA